MPAKKVVKRLRVISRGLAAITMILLVIVAVLALRSYSFITRAVSTEATVIANESRMVRSENSRGTARVSERHRPTFRFTDHAGRQHTVTSSLESAHASRVGARMSILYDPADPQRARVATFFGTWGVAAIVGGAGILVSLMALGFRGARKRVSKR